VVRFGEFALDPQRRILLRRNEPLTLRRQSFDVLCYLIEHNGRAVAKDELIKSVWTAPPGDPDDSVAKCVSEIREALGADARWMIKTITSRGYQFVGDVAPADEPSRRNASSFVLEAKSRIRHFIAAGGYARFLVLGVVAAGLIGLFQYWQVQARPAPALTMMAVPTLVILPFNTSGDSAGPLDTLTDDVRTEFARTPKGFAIVVRSPPQGQDLSLALTTLARKFDARYVLQGRIYDEGSHRRVNVQLIEAETNRQIWAEPFDFAPGQTNAQYAVAVRIARQLTFAISHAEVVRPLPARLEVGHYLIQARHLLEGEGSPERHAKAQQLFKKAMDLDPQSIHAALSYARTKINDAEGALTAEDRDAALQQAEAAIDRIALQRKDHPWVQLLRGMTLRLRQDLDRSAAALHLALTLNPNQPFVHAELGRTLIDMGKADEALQHVRRAIELSPTDVSLALWYEIAGYAALHLGDYAAATDWYLKARQANPGNVVSKRWLAVSYAGLGQHDKAKALMREHLKSVPSFSIAGWKASQPPDNPLVATQRAKLAAILLLLEVPAHAPQHVTKRAER